MLHPGRLRHPYPVEVAKGKGRGPSQDHRRPELRRPPLSGCGVAVSLIPWPAADASACPHDAPRTLERFTHSSCVTGPVDVGATDAGATVGGGSGPVTSPRPDLYCRLTRGGR
jgi:hypothetical protein